MSFDSEEKQILDGLKLLEENVVEFIEEYRDCFPDMEIDENTITIPVSSERVWKLTMKLTKIKPKM